MSTTEQLDIDTNVEAVAFGIFASSSVWVTREGSMIGRVRELWDAMPVEDRARWLQRGRDTITYALSYAP